MEEAKITLESGKEITQEAVDAILEKGVDFKITMSDPSLLCRLLQRLKILPIEKIFIIKPIRLGTLLKIAKILETIEPESLEVLKNEKADGIFGVGIKSIIENKDKIVLIVAHAIDRKKAKPPRSLIKFLDENLTPKELFKILTLVIRQMDVTDFLACMVSATQKMNLLTETKKKKEDE